MRVVLLAAVAAQLLLAASPAAAAPRKVGAPTTSWSVSRIVQGAGPEVIGHDTTRARTFFKRFDLGRQGFTFTDPHLSANARPEVSWTRDDQAVLAQAPSLDRLRPQGSAKGSVAHLSMVQVFEKDAGSASLRIRLRDVLLELVDANGPLSAAECPVVGTAPCPSLRSIVRVRARAWKLAGGRPLLDLGGAVYAEGHEHAWVQGAVTDARSRGPFWEGANFLVRQDRDGNGTQAHFEMFPAPNIDLVVPLRSLTARQRFAVRVTMDAEAIDDRGGESAAQAFVVDPEDAAPALSSRGLKRLRRLKVTEPRVRSQPLARCPAPPRHAGRLQFSSATFSVGEASGTPMVLVTRTGGSRGASTVTVRTRGDSHDFKPTRTRVRFENGDTSPRLVEIPIREDLIAEPPETFTVSLSHPRCAKLGKRRTATVTILDDDQPPPPPPPSFTVGGTVDGLAGSGLVLVNRGTELHVTGNGAFTFPGTFPDGSPLDVRVQTQPTNPSQACTVAGGTGTITADVTDVAVHCATVPTRGLDTSFGDGGRVSVPGAGEARAVLLNRDDQIITVGPRAVGTTFQTQFGATRHDAAGNPDLSFGTDGLAETRLGGADDKAFDAALREDGRFVAVGQADPHGLANTDFGVMAYTADGQPDVTFATGGFRTTDIAGLSDVANAVAVQAVDGKILVVGSTFTTPVDEDFALVRYNQDGSLDTSFGGDGIVTTDFGTENDVARAVEVGRDAIVVAGNAGEDIAIARYGLDGELDRTLDGDGKLVSDLGLDEVANGVRVSFGDAILVAGTRLGPRLNLEGMVASYGANGRLNTGFGTNGVAEADLSDGNDFGDDIAFAFNNDGIILVGTTASATVTDMSLVRFDLDGRIDATVTADFHGAGDFGHDVLVDRSGAVVAAGSTANGGDNQFALLRAFF